jgi:molecular chaperone DnaK (HSP70)
MMSLGLVTSGMSVADQGWRLVIHDELTSLIRCYPLCRGNTHLGGEDFDQRLMEFV